MKLKAILHINSSLENCKKIKNELIDKCNKVYFNLNKQKNNTSLKLIYNQAKKCGAIVKGDFVIAIDSVSNQ